MVIDNFKYILMCGGDYQSFETPRQLSVVKGETLVERTIRLLRENGIKDIAISSNNPIFEKFGVPVLKHNNPYLINKEDKVVGGQWFDAFYPTNEPACYIFGDVYFSPEAIKTIVETKTNDIELFGSKKPFANNYIKPHEEPFALKVANQKHLHEAIQKSRELDASHKFWRKPLVWELFTVIKNAPLQTKRDCYTTDYVGISDYTCDIDRKNDIIKLQIALGGNDMVKLQATQDFTLSLFNEIKITKRANADKNENGWVYNDDEFECNDAVADYLMGNNDQKVIVAKILEVIPEVKKNEFTMKEDTTIKETKKKKRSKK